MTLNYGLFINALISLLIIAVVMFFVIRAINRLQAKETPAPTTKECPFCCSSIPLAAKRCPNCTSELPAAQ